MNTYRFLGSSVSPGGRPNLVLDRVLGIALAAALAPESSRTFATNLALGVLEFVENDVAHRSLSVLDGAPGGLKLYDDLSHFFTRSGSLVVELASVRGPLVGRLVSLATVALPVVAGVLGLEGGASFLADVVVALSWPYVALFYAHALVFRCHIAVSREMYLLFRGKWQEREPEAESRELVLEHVIVGVLLLTPLLFLLPTVAVYYAFWLAVFLGLKITLLVLQALTLGVELLPFSPLWLRFRRPELFQTGIYLDYDGMASGEASKTPQAHVIAKPCYKPYHELVLDAYWVPSKLLLLEIVRDLSRGCRGRLLSPCFVKL